MNKKFLLLLQNARSEQRVRTLRQTVLIKANFWPRVQHPCPYCASITSVPFRSGFYSFPIIKYGHISVMRFVCLPVLPGMLENPERSGTKRNGMEPEVIVPNIIDSRITVSMPILGLPTKKSKVLRFQICCTRTKAPFTRTNPGYFNPD